MTQELSASQLTMERREESRLRHRDYSIARAMAHKAIKDGVGDVYAIEDPRELVSKFTYAAEEAAYLAIQADRDQHQHDMKYLDKVMKLHLQDLSTRPAPQVIFPLPEPPQ